MILQKVFDKVRRITHTTSITLPDSRLLDLINETDLDIQKKLAFNGIDLFGTIKSTSLVANQESYDLPDDLLVIVRLEANYDDPTDDTKWKKLERTDLANIPTKWFDLIKSQPKTNALYDLFGGQIITCPRSKENQTSGLRLWYVAKRTDFTSASDTIPSELDKHWGVLAWGTAYNYLEEVGDVKANRALELYTNYLDQMIKELKKESLEPVKTEHISEYNNGYI